MAVANVLYICYNFLNLAVEVLITMKRTVWNVYDQFRCLADKCPDSCCKGWEVDVDEEAAAAYRAMEGSLGERLRQVLKTEDGSTSMILENGRCPMWRQDGLCQIQAEKGHDGLCRVCREYPRLYMDYGDFSEWGLEMSCPEAARLLFADTSVTGEEIPGGSTAEYDGDVMACLQESRRQLLETLEQASDTVAGYLKTLLLYAHAVQCCIDGGDAAHIQPGETLIKSPAAPGGSFAPTFAYKNAPIHKVFRRFSTQNWKQNLSRDSSCRFNHRFPGDSTPSAVTEPGDITLLLDFFKGLEILTPQWQARLDQPRPGQWDSRLIQFIKYMVRRYWYHGVWDFDLVARAKLIVAACILIHHLGGDTVETAQLFCKEIENDPDNMDAILDAAYTHPALTDQNLLGLLIVE